MRWNVLITIGGMGVCAAACGGDDDGVAAVDAAGGGGADAARADAGATADAATPDAAGTDTGVDPGTLVVLPGSFVLLCDVPQQLTAILVRDGSGVDVTDLAVWSSTDPDIATVDAGGLATFTNIGEVEIEVMYDGLTAFTTAQTSCPDVVSVEVKPPFVTLSAGCAPVALTATATFSDDTTGDVTDAAEWTSSNPAVATVSASGLVQGVAAGGPVTITAYYVEEGSAQIIVTGIEIDGITIAPESASIPVGEYQSFAATVHWVFGSTEDVTHDTGITWSSDDEDVAAFAADGYLYSVAPGTTQIHAVLEVCSSTFVAPPATVTVTEGGAP